MQIGSETERQTNGQADRYAQTMKRTGIQDGQTHGRKNKQIDPISPLALSLLGEIIPLTASILTLHLSPPALISTELFLLPVLIPDLSFSVSAPIPYLVLLINSS